MSFWCGPDGRDRFYRYYLNEPFHQKRAELDAMTDREVYEHLYRHYEKPDAADRIDEIDERQARAEAAFREKPLAERKKEFWDLCRNYGHKDAAIQKQWDAYLKGG